MNTYEKQLLDKGYIKLELGSYRKWISLKWHRMFIRRGLVRKNFYKQYSPVLERLDEFCKWDTLYDKIQHDRDFPKSIRLITEEEMREIRQTIV